MSEEKDKIVTIKDLMRVLDQQAKRNDERFMQLEKSIADINQALNIGIPKIMEKLKAHDEFITAVTGQGNPTPATQSSPTQTNPTQPNPLANPILQMIFAGLARGSSSSGSLDDMVKYTEAIVKIADNLDRFRNPRLPYAPADIFLMKAGARSVYKLVYEGKKEPSEEEIEEALGLKRKKEEESKE